MTLEEALAASEAEPVNDIFTVNPESRTITVPDTEKIFGVFSDGNTERKHFRCPKIVGDNIDLSTMHLYVNYQNANGEKSAYLVEDVQTDEDYITFSWLISPNVTAYKGQIKYIVCAKNGATAEWNTTLAEGTVLEGLEATEEIVEKNPDIIEQILARLDNVTEVPQEKISSAVEEYLQKNPVSVPTKLSDLQDDTTYRTLTRFRSGNNQAARIHMPRATRLCTTARHGRAPRITTSGSRVCMDGKRCRMYGNQSKTVRSYFYAIL